MNIKHERNQAAGHQEHSDFPPEELCLKPALNLENDMIASLEQNIPDMEEVQRPAETGEPNFCQISESDRESSFLVSTQGLIGRRLKRLDRHQEGESELVPFTNQERDEIVEKYEHKLSELRIIIVDLLKDKQDSSLQHLHFVEALEVKIKSLEENAGDHHLKEQEIKDLKDKHQIEVKDLKEGMVNLKLTNNNLLSKLNEANHQLKVQEQSWKAKYDDLDSSYERKLNKTLLLTRKANKATQKILDKKFKATLKQNDSLLEQLEAASDNRTVLVHTHKQLIDERTLLEDICLQLKKKCRGTFGKRMQEREVELAKMKRKMREKQTTTPTPTPTQTPTPTTYEGTTRDADGRRPQDPYSLRKRLKHLKD